MITHFHDVFQIRKWWKENSHIFGRPYYDYIDEQVKNNRYLCYEVNGLPIGMVSYSINNKKSQVSIDCLYVIEEFRYQHIATKLLHAVYLEAESLFKNYYYDMEITVTITPDNVTENILSFLDKIGYIDTMDASKAKYTYFVDTYLW